MHEQAESRRLTVQKVVVFETTEEGLTSAERGRQGRRKQPSSHASRENE
jgi:hypothetical protein